MLPPEKTVRALQRTELVSGQTVADAIYAIDEDVDLVDICVEFDFGAGICYFEWWKTVPNKYYEQELIAHNKWKEEHDRKDD